MSFIYYKNNIKNTSPLLNDVWHLQSVQRSVKRLWGQVKPLSVSGSSTTKMNRIGKKRSRPNMCMIQYVYDGVLYILLI